MSLFELPPCQGCGGPITATSGQWISVTTDVKLDDAGDVLEVKNKSGWCGNCLAEWDERMAS